MTRPTLAPRRNAVVPRHTMPAPNADPGSRTRIALGASSGIWWVKVVNAAVVVSLQNQIGGQVRSSTLRISSLKSVLLRPAKNSSPFATLDLLAESVAPPYGTRSSSPSSRESTPRAGFRPTIPATCSPTSSATTPRPGDPRGQPLDLPVRVDPNRETA